LTERFSFFTGLRLGMTVEAWVRWNGGSRETAPG